MQFDEILTPESIKRLSSCSSKKRLFHDLGEMAESTLGLPANEVVEALMEREALGPTGVGGGVALPHARLDDLDRVRGLFLRLEKPINFDAVDRQPVDLVFALLAPETAGVEHLKALAMVSRTLRDPATCAKLRANSDPATLHMILSEANASQAA
ncbi:PTS IIA-like nitrogen regulatory protein PtsN [Histidinibacterium aquaticum]|uniref:PTS IIA-like nitrogen regulatory protein PtsN n=1 Tax=Histidinibacterium aquaticum TaxID=2613962 RepID=A0A5J5GHC2_9RHOB|nr:PTS IIA-like nitrogen regulatory protein PtsN [Histidinibacterium aquaticum]KAA9006934.1 PTS IIA-like nitrogen regulatory protein PtsN [Histidinibacterium aquaticum]